MTSSAYLTAEQSAALAASMRGERVRTRRHRPSVTAGKRRTVFARDGHACVQCGSTEDLTLDHITPLCRGGSNRNDNLQVLCRPCNNAKADEWR